jgi:cell division protein FtsB
MSKICQREKEKQELEAKLATLNEEITFLNEMIQKLEKSKDKMTLEIVRDSLQPLYSSLETKQRERKEIVDRISVLS